MMEDLSSYDKVFVLTDENTHRQCFPIFVNKNEVKRDFSEIVIPAGDVNKTLDTAQKVWHKLQEGGATRHSLLINLGGGVVTDLGGFSASTFKRGMDYLNIPTTLLAMVDASTGGKTGVNFGGLKNEIGVFKEPKEVVIDTDYLKSLDEENLLSGFAEAIKHCLLEKDGDLNRVLGNYQEFICDKDFIEKNIEVKRKVVKEDPFEKGIRKALNLGHTVGHAFESWAMKTEHPILHGYAVAYGLICELWLSTVHCNFPVEKMRVVVNFVKENYGMLPVTCDDYEELYSLMTHDKKNVGGNGDEDNLINFTLLADVGDIRINQVLNKKQIIESLDFFRDGC